MQAGLLLVLAAASVAGVADPGFDPASKPASATPATECDALIRMAVKRPYGWAWGPDGPADDPARSAQRPVSFAPMSSASAGLVLWIAGEELNEPKYRQSAIQAARGIAAAQDPSGRIPATAVFGPTVNTREAAGQCPSRSATCAGLGLLLTILDSHEKVDESIQRCAIRAAAWLQKQQTPAGGWPTLATDPFSNDTQRIILLEGTDYRDCTLALILAHEVLGETATTRPANQAVDQLIKLRFAEVKGARHLWSTAGGLDGRPTDVMPQYPLAVDSLASRRALQTLLAASAILGHESAGEALRDSAAALAALRRPDGDWNHFYPFDNGVLRRPTSQPAPPPASNSFAPVSRPTVPEFYRAGDYGIPATLAEIERLEQVGRERYIAGLNVKRRLALTIAGLTDGPFGETAPALPDTDVPVRVDAIWKKRTRK